MTSEPDRTSPPSGPGGNDLPARFTAFMVRGMERLSRFPSPRLRGPLLAVAAGVFLVGGVIAALRLDLVWRDLGWGWILLAAGVGVPASVCGKTLEFQLSGRIIGARIPFPVAVRVSVLASAANLLPIPGSVLVRIQALRQAGYPYSQATFTTALMGFAWVGVASAAAGGSLIAFGLLLPGIVWTLCGGFLLFTTFALAKRRLVTGTRLRLTAAVLGVETLAVAVGALRLYAILLALGEPATITAATLLTLAGVLASAIGILPGGLGLRELLAAVLVPIAGLAAAVGFIASAIDRLVGLAVHAPLAGAYSFHRDATEETGGRGGGVDRFSSRRNQSRGDES